VKWLAAALLTVLVLLQYRLWLSASGVQDLGRLASAVAQQKGEDERLAERNRQLAAEVRDLKSGFGALEERARSDLGMIANSETFYQVVPAHPAAESKAPTRTASR
jgi:cell division protein FtsB